MRLQRTDMMGLLSGTVVKQLNCKPGMPSRCASQSPSLSSTISSLLMHLKGRRGPRKYLGALPSTWRFSCSSESWLWPEPDLAVVADICRVKNQMKNPSPSLLFSDQLLLDLSQKPERQQVKKSETERERERDE